jgi:hypothetical protein
MKPSGDAFPAMAGDDRMAEGYSEQVNTTADSWQYAVYLDISPSDTCE